MSPRLPAVLYSPAPRSYLYHPLVFVETKQTHLSYTCRNGHIRSVKCDSIHMLV